MGDGKRRGGTFCELWDVGGDCSCFDVLKMVVGKRKRKRK